MANGRKNNKRTKHKQNTGKHSIDSVQKTAILGTSHIIRKVLQTETRALNGGDSHWFYEVKYWGEEACDRRPKNHNDNENKNYNNITQKLV